MMVRFIIAAVFIVVGLFIFAVAAFGVFRFRYVLNRMHIAAQSDTMGLLLCLIGAMILTGFTFATLKIILILGFFWAASPLCSHLLASAEICSQEPEDADELEAEVINDDGA